MTNFQLFSEKSARAAAEKEKKEEEERQKREEERRKIEERKRAGTFVFLIKNGFYLYKINLN